MDHFDVVAVGIEEEAGVVARMIFPFAIRPPVFAGVLKRRRNKQLMRFSVLACSLATAYVPSTCWVGCWVDAAVSTPDCASVARAKTPGYIHDGGGLYLQVARAGSRSWVFRFSLGGKRREMGLGPYPGVSLAAARKSASSRVRW